MKEYAAWGGIVSAAFFGPHGPLWHDVRESQRQHRLHDEDVAVQSRLTLATALLAAISVLLQGLEKVSLAIRRTQRQFALHQNGPIVGFAR